VIKRLAIGFACLTMLAVVPAFAGAASTNLSVSATISNNCTIATSPVAFGAYDPIVTNLATPLDGAGTVSITCTKGAVTTIALGLGANATGTTRRMTDGASDYITYEAYQPPDSIPGTACSYAAPTVWGTAGGNLFTPAVAPSKATRTYNVCGRVAAGQDQPAGGYNDTVLATVNF
jgi:spore coat protein U domain-containing protein, fimbrial subunit CupE1/2/3/6